jgi:hypothetical protein
MYILYTLNKNEHRERVLLATSQEVVLQYSLQEHELAAFEHFRCHTASFLRLLKPNCPRRLVNLKGTIA